MTKKLMIQGTMSNAGKSLIAAGLCRIFSQDGYRTAPFKSQNMALNSFITEDGLEMGRAQAMQAEACGIAPSVHMNPILLKPVTDMGSQVIVNGKVRGNMQAAEYFRYKKKLIPDILSALGELEKNYDVIVIEGAGSPAEINLKSEDIVNMGMAEMADAPVLLVGDIDRGGVFAQLIGTMMLLEKQERARVKGLIINKFRGDKNLLQPGLDMLEGRCQVPVLGVVPYFSVDLEDEDSLSARLEQKRVLEQIDLAVIRFPHISNFTDFNALDTIEGCSVRYVESASELKETDMILLPGSKNTIGDLKWMRKSGLEAAILQAAKKNVLIFGICGGYQMLGEDLEDPLGIEGGGSVQGMGLLPMKTVFTEQKVRTRVQGRTLGLTGEYKELSNAFVEGYEIHMGITRISGPSNEAMKPFLWLRDQTGEKTDGICWKNICGTYVHGVFDSGQMQEKIKQLLYRRKGIACGSAGERSSYQEYKQTQYDLLADCLRQSLNMKEIYNILR